MHSFAMDHPSSDFWGGWSSGGWSSGGWSSGGRCGVWWPSCFAFLFIGVRGLSGGWGGFVGFVCLMKGDGERAVGTSEKGRGFYQTCCRWMGRKELFGKGGAPCGGEGGGGMVEILGVGDWYGAVRKHQRVRTGFRFAN